VSSEKVIETKNGTRYNRVKQFYLGYVFVRMKSYNEEENLLQSQWHFARNVQGLLNCVAEDRLVPLREDEVARILDQVAEAGMAEPVQRIQCAKGSQVRMTDGPFTESLREAGELDPENGEIRVCLSLFGREILVELEFLQTEIVKK
jgi:transcriptional antiterminator NusG